MRTLVILSALFLGALVRPDFSPVAIDAAGRAMLDPMRFRALSPPDLVARLHLDPTSTVADVGAGPGFLTEYLARAVPRGTVIATDMRAEYLPVLASRMRGGDRERGDPSRGARRGGAPTGSIDLALLCQVDHYLDDREGYLRTLLPSLRPRGRIVLVNYARYRDAGPAAARRCRCRWWTSGRRRRRSLCSCWRGGRTMTDARRWWCWSRSRRAVTSRHRRRATSRVATWPTAGDGGCLAGTPPTSLYEDGCAAGRCYYDDPPTDGF